MWIDLGPKESVFSDKKQKVIRLNEAPVLLHLTSEGVVAIDNRCPHMGYPLSQGTLQSGRLECHWHHWRFDASSGGCLTAGGDDVPSYETQISPEGHLLIQDTPRQPARTALQQGLEEASSYLLAKAVRQEIGKHNKTNEIASHGVARFIAVGGTFSAAMIILNISAKEAAKEASLAHLALTHGLVEIARHTKNRPPRIIEPALLHSNTPSERLHQWFLQSLEERDPKPAERLLRTQYQRTHNLEEITSWVLDAMSRHLFLATGHVLDQLRHAYELAKRYPHLAVDLILSVLPAITTAERHEEDPAWADLLPELQKSQVKEDWFNSQCETGSPPDPDLFLQDNWPVLFATVMQNVQEHSLQEWTFAFFIAARRRYQQVPLKNEMDWDDAHHAVVYAYSLYKLSLYLPQAPALYRTFLQGASYLYLIRFINQPLAQIAKKTLPSSTMDDLPTLFAAGDVNTVGEMALSLPADLIESALRSLALHEDLGFHGFQSLELLEIAGSQVAISRFLTAQRRKRQIPWAVANAEILNHGRDE